MRKANNKNHIRPRLQRRICRIISIFRGDFYHRDTKGTEFSYSFSVYGHCLPILTLFVGTARLWLGREICLSISISPCLYLSVSVYFEYSAGS